jgi:glycerophosphoryl diester phosphodiesterase
MRPLVYGHRGARQRAPENTLAAFDLAIDEGADGIELDVRLDASREVVVIHDRTVGPGLRDVERVRGGDVGLPRLDEVLAWALRRDVRVNIELKPDVTRREVLVRRVAGLIHRFPDAPDRILFSSMHPGLLAWLGKLLPDVPRAWVGAPEIADLWREPLWPGLGQIHVNPHWSLVDAQRIAELRWRRAECNVWTVNDPAEARRLAELGVDGIITDDPAGILQALG